MLAKATTPTARALFDADVLGWPDWPPDESELGSVISADVWAALANPTPELVGPIAVAVDRSQDRKTWSICAAQHTTDGRIHIELSPYENIWQADVLEKLTDIVIEWDPISLTIDARSAAAPIRPALEALGVEANMTNTLDMQLACGAFLDSVEAQQISHSDQTVLNDAVVSAVKRGLGQAFARAWAPGVCNLVAASLAHWALLSAKQTAHKRSLPPLADTPSGGDFDREPGRWTL